MSYSRWIQSKFYTYWSSTDGDNKQDEIFACHIDIDSSYMLTYTECQQYVNDIKFLSSKIHITEEQDLVEIQSYMKQFISDVDREYEIVKMTLEV